MKEGTRWRTLLSTFLCVGALVYPANADVADHVTGIEIYTGISLETEEYELEVVVECDATVTSISGIAPFGPFVCVQEGGEWGFETAIPMGNSAPEVDGNWSFGFQYDGGSSDSSVIPYEQADGLPLVAITNCPQVISPDLAAGIVFEGDAVVAWDSLFDSSANFAGIGYYDSALDNDVDVEFFGAELLLTEYDAIPFDLGIEELWIYNAFVREGENVDGIAFTVGRYASYDYEFTVFPAPGTADVSAHVLLVEIYAGLLLESDEYAAEVIVKADAEVVGVLGQAPFGFFQCELDGDEWAFEGAVPVAAGRPPVDGDWTMMVYFADGTSGTTVVPFEQMNSAPLPVISSCPGFTEPDLSMGFLFETNMMLRWTEAFDASANFAGVEYWNPGTNEGVEFEYEEGDFGTREAGPVNFVEGVDDLFIFNAFFVEGNTADGIPFAIGSFASHDYEVVVLPGAGGVDVGEHVSKIEIYAGYSLETDGYEIEAELSGDAAVAGVSGFAPFGAFTCELDGETWEFDLEIPASGELPEVDGDWTFVVSLTNGTSGLTVISFEKSDGSSLPIITTCPELISPGFTSDYMLETNLTVRWGSAFNAAANIGGIGYWNELTQEDVDVEFVEDDLALLEYGPVEIVAGTKEFWIFNGYFVEGVNEDGVDFFVARFASYDYETTVTRGEWDLDADHLSNEWELRYFGGMVDAVASADSDNDGADNLTEFLAGTDPWFGASIYELSAAVVANGSNVEVSWATPSSERVVSVFGAERLTDKFTVLAPNIVGETTFAETQRDKGFYLVQVHPNYEADETYTPLKNIEIDGSAVDWGTQVPCLVETVGDGGAFSGLDVTGVYFARGATELFVRIDRAGLAMPGTGEYASIWVNFEAAGTGSRYGLNISGVDGQLVGNSVDRLVDENFDNNVRLVTGVPMNADGQSIELAIPLSAVDFAGQFLISIYTHYSIGGEFGDNGDFTENRGLLSVP